MLQKHCTVYSICNGCTYSIFHLSFHFAYHFGGWALTFSQKWSSSKRFWDAHWGFCRSTDEFCHSRSKSDPAWGVPLHFLNVFLRAVTQIGFVNNPYSGAVILATVAWASPHAALGCAVGGGVAAAAEMALRLQPEVLLRGGVSPFNAALIGMVAGSISTPEEREGPTLWLLIAGAGLVRYHFH